MFYRHTNTFPNMSLVMPSYNGAALGSSNLGQTSGFVPGTYNNYVHAPSIGTSVSLATNSMGTVPLGSVLSPPVTASTGLLQPVSLAQQQYKGGYAPPLSSLSSPVVQASCSPTVASYAAPVQMVPADTLSIASVPATQAHEPTYSTHLAMHRAPVHTHAVATVPVVQTFEPVKLGTRVA